RIVGEHGCAVYGAIFLGLKADAEVAACTGRQREACAAICRSARTWNLGEVCADAHPGSDGIQRLVADILDCDRFGTVAAGLPHVGRSKAERRRLRALQ